MVCEASAVLPLLVVVANDVCGVIVGADEAAEVMPGCETSLEVNAAAAARQCSAIAWAQAVR